MFVTPLGYLVLGHGVLVDLLDWIFPPAREPVSIKCKNKETHDRDRERDYGWGVRVRRHLAHAEGVLYGMELGDLKENWFLLFSN